MKSETSSPNLSPAQCEMRYFSPADLCLFLVTLLVLSMTESAVADSQEIGQAELEFFEKKIRPVLVEHCYECHASDSKSIRGGLLVDSAVAFRKGGDSGAAIVPGEPTQGTLLDALRHETFEMPPKQKLPEQVIQNFETWITMGAPDPRNETPAGSPTHTGVDIAEGREFWSFKAIQKPELPRVKNKDWSKNGIDQFILAAQEANNLQPGPEGDPLTLLRRLSFDLTGLPPTFEQIQQFQSEIPDGRWERLIDELLASPQFGERWGRHWLDLARYSNSTGGGRSLLYGESWRYRNYVIDSYNKDKPFDQFIREQIAGDLLKTDDYKKRQEQYVGTGFLALGPHNYENQDKEQLRMDVVDEQIDTVGRVFLGMTIGCARCHDHKFDPIPTTDYYALAGIFRSTNSLVPGNVSRWVSTPMPLSPADQAANEAYQSELKSINRKIAKLQTTIKELKVGLPSEIQDNLEAEVVGNWTESTSIKGYVKQNYQHTSDLTASATYHFTTDPGLYEVQFSYTPGSNRTKRAKVTVEHAAGNKEFFINQQLQPAVDGTFHSLGNFELGENLNVVIQPSETEVTIIDAVRLISLNEADSDLIVKQQEQIKVAEKKLNSSQKILKQLKETAPKPPPQIVSVEEQETQEDYFVCIRGDAHNLGKPVPRGVLSVVESSEDLNIPDGVSGRLELANWIAHADNPLTARVFVNRVWKHLFGVGLVRTVDNFGLPGETPSHPELLDFLANQFMEDNWSVKELIRNIVLSKTYRLASEPLSESSIDPENRLLTHQNRKRLTAEAIQDALLLVSGELDLTPAESMIRSGTKSEYGYQFDFGKRAVYLPIFRNRLPDIFVVFDFPNPNMPQGKRTTSNISPQSLFLMNSDFVSLRSQRTAEKVMKIAETTDERIKWLTLAILSRYPSSDEQRLFVEYLGEEPDSVERWSQIVQSLFGSIDFRYSE